VYGGALYAFGIYESADPGDGDEYQFDVWRRGEDADGSVGLLLDDLGLNCSENMIKCWIL
ncbi:MAG: hypothetical protein M0P07_06040, partial [Candidatus Methanomethylophilaceae archaeon]|nr:hypothetical protein [Candidatus Methanomethylophilaceae archaeon]